MAAFRPAVLLACATMLPLVGCGDSGSATVSTPDSAVETTVTPQTSAVESSTSPSTVAAAEDSAVAAEEDAVRDIHGQFMFDLFARDELKDGPEVILLLAEQLTTGHELARLQEGVAQRLEDDERVLSAGYDSNVISLTVDGDAAAVVDCSQDRAFVYKTSGALISDLDDAWNLRQTTLAKIDGVWHVEQFDHEGGDACDPAQ